MSDWNPKANQIFLEALDRKSSESQQAYLDEACGSDQELRDHVESLLEADLEAPSMLDRHAAVLTIDHQVTDCIGTQIGLYKLREQIAEGGMGVVYVAEQFEPVARKVALKVIKPGMDTKQVIARFEAERRVLAMMDHPNIARILDGGATDTGQPFFVMELVRGIPVTEYCDQQRLTTRERLQLFLIVCRAVQHAHQKGIIHRDIKPSNVLVGQIDGAAVPKVIDFGVAKAVSQNLTEQTVYTQFSQMVGTPMYMSPEQAGMDLVDVDTRSDVYSLAVLLYELLTGSTPFDQETVKKAGSDELRRIIREEEPRRPSAALSTLQAQALSTVGAHRQIDPRKLCDALKGELDWIVMKALEKDRNRRYESASALAADVQRYLNDEPVVACPPSVAYRFRKYGRRHKAQLLTVAAISAVLVAATVVSSSLAAWAVREQGLARRSEQVAKLDRAEALDARALAEQQEHLANQQRDAAEYDAYVANFQLSQSTWERGKLPFKSLAAVAPEPGRPDFRGWEWYFLHSQVHCQRLTLPFQHHIAWSPSAKYLATVDQTGLVNIQDVRTGVLEKSLRGCPGNILSLSWSSDGKHLAAGSDRKVVVIWDVESGLILRSLRNSAAVHRVDWNPDSIRLASAGQDGAICIWDWRTGERLSSLFVGGGTVFALDWHPEGTLLLAFGGPGGSRVLKVWDTATGAEVMHRKTGWGNVASFSPDGKRIVFGTDPFSIVDLETQELVASFGDYASHLQSWSPDGRRVASSSTGQIEIRDVETGAVTASIPEAAIKELVWSPAGRLLTTGVNRTVKVWDSVALQDKVRTLSTPGRYVLSVAFSPDGRRLLGSARYGLVRMWDAESGSEMFSVQSGHNSMRRVAFSPDGKRFAATVQSNGVMICDAETGKQLLHTAPSQDQARSVAWSPDGKTLAVGYRNIHFKQYRGRVELFDAHSAEKIAASSYAEGPCDAVAWSPDGSRLAAAADTQSIRIWDPMLQDEIVVAVEARSLDWSPDSKRLVIGGSEGTITIYDAATWMPIRTLEGHTDSINGVDWHPHMPRVASGSVEGTVRIFDTSTGRELCVLEAHGTVVQWVAWSHDGLRLASAGNDGAVRVWDGSMADRYLKRHGDLRQNNNKSISARLKSSSSCAGFIRKKRS